jgi:hypothetical protein
VRSGVPGQVRVRIANGPAAGLPVMVTLDAQGYPPAETLVAIVAGQAVARPPRPGPDGSDADGAWMAYAAQQVGRGRWEYVVERFSRV